MQSTTSAIHKASLHFQMAFRARMVAFPSFTADACRARCCSFSVQTRGRRDRRKDEGDLYKLKALKQTQCLSCFPKPTAEPLREEYFLPCFQLSSPNSVSSNSVGPRKHSPSMSYVPVMMPTAGTRERARHTAFSQNIYSAGERADIPENQRLLLETMKPTGDITRAQATKSGL